MSTHTSALGCFLAQTVLSALFMYGFIYVPECSGAYASDLALFDSGKVQKEGNFDVSRGARRPDDPYLVPSRDGIISFWPSMSHSTHSALQLEVFLFQNLLPVVVTRRASNLTPCFCFWVSGDGFCGSDGVLIYMSRS
jgi:hypothetical protein